MKTTKPMGGDDWEARYDMETLVRAEEIKGDPQRMSRAKDHAKRQADAAAEAVKAMSGNDGDALAQGYRKLR